MKTFLITVAIRITTHGKHWWSDTRYYTALFQCLRKAETEDVAESIAVKDALDKYRKSNPDSEVCMTNTSVWDVTDKLK